MLGMISTRLFWKGYHLWKKRKGLVSHLWKHILPVEWNKSSHTKARKRVMQDSLCKDPFHYFQKLFAYSTQKITKCPCSKVLLTKRSRTGDICSFLTKVPRIIDSDLFLILTVLYWTCWIRCPLWRVKRRSVSVTGR